MNRCILLAMALNISSALALSPPAPPVTIHGKLDEAFWQQVAPGKLTPTQPGVPAQRGGEVRAAVAGRYLYLSASLPEPSGRVTARSIGRNPIWEGGGESQVVSSLHEYTYGSPEGEDFVRFILRVSDENDWMVQVGPLGAYTVKWRWTGEREWYPSPAEKCDRFLVAARIGAKEWSAEAAIPLDQLGSPRPGSLRLSVERNRAQRPGTPQERWRWPAQEPSSEVVTIPSAGSNPPEPAFQPPVLGNREAPIEVGFKQGLPPFQSGWTDPGWRDVPVWVLSRNEASRRLPRLPTEIKLLHDDHTLAVLARCIEPAPVVAHAEERDGEVDADDSVQVYLATSGSAYVEYAINPAGFVLDAAGHSGNPRLSRPHFDWDSPVRRMARQQQGEWLARLDLPLDEIAESLGEVRPPREWRILLLRSRPSRDGEPREISVLPVTQSETPFCPARYRRLKLVETDSSQLHAPPITKPSGNLGFFPTRVLTPQQRKELNLAEMVNHNLRTRTLKILEQEKREWDQVATLTDWEHFRDRRMKALVASLGALPARGPFETRVTSEYRGEGYRRLNLVYQSRPGLWATANLYLPAEPHAKMPGIVIVHSHHAPKTQFELQDMGIIWARAGCAVLVMDQIGHGERLEIYPWDREAHNSSHILGMQLQLAGENLMAWIVADILRGVDLLLERGDVNPERILLLGAVAGGGDPAAVAAAIDKRIAAVVPFNFGEAEPEELRTDPHKNQWPLDLADPGWGDMVSTGALRGAIAEQFFPWTICAAVAPRRFVYSFELGWNVEDLPAWPRYRKVFGLYNALDHLADAHGFGPFPGPGECWNIGPAQRRSLYPTLERWFGIPIPFPEASSSVYENLARRPGTDRRPVPELAVLTPRIAAELNIQSIHALAHEEGEHEVNAARAGLAKLSPEERRAWLRARWSKILGDIEPNVQAPAALRWKKEIPNAEVEAITLEIEPGITVPLLVLRPSTRAGVQVPLVVGVSEGGKDLFLSQRSQEIARMLKAGVAVCLPDVRGTGETAPDPTLDPDGDEIREHTAATELMLDDTLLGKRLKDLRTVLAYLRGRPDLDPQRLGLWGDSFAPPNPAHMVLDEQVQWQIGPDIQQQAEPLGGLLAVLGALYEDSVRTIAVRGGLASYLSVLDENFIYLPADAVVPGILKSGDIADVEAALAPRRLLLEGLVDGRDRLVADSDRHSQLAPLYEAYRAGPTSALSVHAGEANTDLARWFVSSW